MKKFSNEHIAKLREPFEKIGAFEGYSEEEIKKITEGMAEIFSTMTKISLRIKREKYGER